ncbi:hypothetical protein FOE78_07290 [Microlunatus elymi]|uniref:Uncharacterized protein n=1 Tax=Microlunatus elymi TaxID=2596828 RepID=A0A516PX32_9ACTN|nr:hypothetical protein [Microlunatus elymi]QDP95733.1 hypothetical protein FOE78_07290 [Microlunatus elymi]
MIIWNRWGFLVLLFLGIGVVGGFGLAALAGVPGDGGPLVGLFVGIGLVVAGALLYVLDRFVLSRWDKPTPTLVQERLSSPVTLPNGQQQRYRTSPALDPTTGQPLLARPHSAFLWIPVHVWPYLMAAGGLVIIAICAIRLLL